MKGSARASVAALLVAALGASGCNVEKIFDAKAEARGRSPFTPADLGQYRSDGVAPIAPGDTIGATNVLLRATVADPDSGDSVRLEVELRALATPFEGTPTHASDPSPVGARPTVTVSGLDDSTAYHWQARAVDRTGLASPWVAFGTNADSEPDFGVRIGRPPLVPSSAAQYEEDGTTAIGVGAATAAGTVVLAATVTDPDPDARVRLQVEVQPMGQVFTGSPTGEAAPVASGARASVRVSGLADGTAYRWRYRAMDETGAASSWMAFGENADDAPDFLVAIPTPPAVPGSIGQFRADGTTAIPIGGNTGGSNVVFKGTVSDPDPGDVLTFQVEVRGVGTAFSNVATHSATGLASGDGARVTAAVLPLVGYHWQARTCDARGCSAWTPFGGNPESQADFVGTLVAGAVASGGP